MASAEVGEDVGAEAAERAYFYEGTGGHVFYGVIHGDDVSGIEHSGVGEA